MVNKNHNNQKKIAVINDISGFGRCSIAVSNHTCFESFFFDDYTDKMTSYMNEWIKLDLKFNGICTGFLGSEKQIRIVEEFLSHFKTKENITIIDPVMGDYGKMYPKYTKENCMEIKKRER